MRAHLPKFAVCLTAGLSLLAVTAGADQNDKASTAPIASLWSISKDAQTLTLVIAGQNDPKPFTVTADTEFSGMCKHCGLPLTFEAGESAKNCKVCGCVVTNAACIVGTNVKPATWDAMLKGMPLGIALRPTYNTPDKPESGLKSVLVDLHNVLVPVTGLDNQTPEQLAALVKPAGGKKAELIDGGKKLSIQVLVWTPSFEQKLEKSLEAAGAKIVRAPEAK